MSHNHTPYDNHATSHSFNLAFAIAVSLNLAFTLCQIYFAYLAGSMSLMADAAHNFGDVFGLILAWGANWLMTLPARKRYSYGYKRITILAAIINALILVGTSTLIAFESIYKWLHLSYVNSLIVMIIAGIGILINGGTALLFMKGANDDLNIKGAFFHLLADALISLGVVIAGGIIFFTHAMWLDPLMGLIIVCFILWGTWGLLRDSVRLILDAIPHHIDHQGIRAFLQNFPGVKAVHDLHIWGLSTKEIALTAHLVMPDGMLTDAEYEKINSTLKSQYRIDHATLQVEKGTAEHLCARHNLC